MTHPTPNPRASRHGLALGVMAIGIITFAVMAFGGDGLLDAGIALSRTTAPCCSGDIAPADTLRGTDEANLLTGTSGEDVLIGGGGDDLLRGLAGADLLQVGMGREVLEGGDGSDILEGGEGEDVLSGGSEKEWHFVGEGDDVLRGGDEAGGRGGWKGGREGSTPEAGGCSTYIPEMATASTKSW